jgi:transposase
MIDATIVRVHQHASCWAKERQAVGRSRGGLTTKIHALVDSFGLPLNFFLTGGEVHEIKVAQQLVRPDAENLIGDRGYDSDPFRSWLKKRYINPVIPGKSNRKISIEYDRDIYKERNNVERFFNRIKNFRRISSRFDKTAQMFHGSLVFVSILLWLKI